MENAKGNQWIKLFALILLVGLCIVLFKYTPIATLLDVNAAAAYIKSLGPWGPLGYVALKTGTMLVGIPGASLAVLSGAIFDPYLGFLLSVISILLGSLGTFLIVRYLARDWAEARIREYGGLLERVDKGLERNGFWYVLSARLIPLLPFGITTMALGLSAISLKHFALATVVGILPKTAVFIWLGASGKEALTGGSSAGVWGACFAFGLLSLVPVFGEVWRKSRRPMSTR